MKAEINIFPLPASLSTVLAVATGLSLVVFVTIIAWRFMDTASTAVDYRLGIRDSHQQTTSYSCGPALIASVAARFGVTTTEYALLNSADYTVHGITLAEYDRLARSIGWNGVWYESNVLDELVWLSDTQPLSLHLDFDGGHYVLLHALSHNHALVEDPAVGFSVIHQTTLSQQWTGLFYAAH